MHTHIKRLFADLSSASLGLLLSSLQTCVSPNLSYLLLRYYYQAATLSISAPHRRVVPPLPLIWLTHVPGGGPPKASYQGEQKTWKAEIIPNP